MTENVTPQPAKTEEPRKKSLGMRILIATAFSSIGSKLIIPGAMMDINNIVGKGLTLKEKFSAVLDWDGFKAKAGERANELMRQGKSPGAAIFSVVKYSTVLFTLGTIAGGVLGWIQGGKFEDWKDVMKHPLKATAVVFGFKSAEEFCKEIGKDTCPAADTAKAASKSSTVQSDAAESGKKWTDHVSQRDGHAAAAVQEKAQAATAASIG